MKKEITFNEVSRIFKVFTEWNTLSKSIKLGSVNLYRLIAFKKEIESKEMAIEETIRTIFINNGATETDGLLRAPEDKQDLVVSQVNELSNEKVEIEVPEITLSENDNLPIELMEVLFDFIKVKE